MPVSPSNCWSNFNPRPPRGGRLPSAAFKKLASKISIHAPREGGDCKEFTFYWIYSVISIHAPREGGDSKDAQFYLRIFDK